MTNITFEEAITILKQSINIDEITIAFDDKAGVN